MPCYVINRRFIKFDFGFLVLNIKILKFFGPEFSKKFQMNPDEAPYVINVKKGRNIPESKLSFQKKLVEGKIDANEVEEDADNEENTGLNNLELNETNI